MSKINKMQQMDSGKCEELQVQGVDMDCIECSCMVCLAQEPTDLASGLKLAMEITKKEMEFYREVNNQMAIGMAHILFLLKQELKKHS